MKQWSNGFEGANSEAGKRKRGRKRGGGSDHEGEDRGLRGRISDKHNSALDSLGEEFPHVESQSARGVDLKRGEDLKRREM